MWKKALSVTVLGIATAIPVLAGGCASSSEQPNAVTGQPVSGQDPAAYDKFGNYHSEWEGKPYLNPRFIDDKQHFRADWVNSGVR
jgi:hypothetical protein